MLTLVGVGRGLDQIASGGLSRPSQLTWMLVSVTVGLGQIASGGLSRQSQLTWRSLT